jgi:hypothetical protein
MLSAMCARALCTCGCGNRTRRRDAEGRPDCRQQRKPSGRTWKPLAPAGGWRIQKSSGRWRIHGKTPQPLARLARRAAAPPPQPVSPMAQGSPPGPAAPMANSGQASLAALGPAGEGGRALAPAGGMATPGGFLLTGEWRRPAPRGEWRRPSLPRNMRELEDWLDGIRIGSATALGAKQWGFCWQTHVMSFVEKEPFDAAFAAAVASGELACSAFCFNVVAYGAKLMGGSFGEAVTATAELWEEAKTSPYQVLTDYVALRSNEPEWVRLSRRADWALTCVFLGLEGAPFWLA